MVLRKQGLSFMSQWEMFLSAMLSHISLCDACTLAATRQAARSWPASCSTWHQSLQIGCALSTKATFFYFYSHSLTSPITSRIVMAPMLARQRRSGESRGRRRQQAQRASGWTNEASGRLSARSWLSCQCVCARMGVRLWCCGLCWQWAIMARMT